MRILPFLCLLAQCSLGQELVSTEFAKGYVKDGQKYLVWEYYNDNKEIELIINHTTGRLISLKEDTTAYVVDEGGHWVQKNFRVYPIPIGGYSFFYHTIKKNLRFPAQARMQGIDGQVLIMFEVDSLGRQANYSLISDPGGGLGEEVLRALRENEFGWIQAQADNRTYRSRFILPVTYGLGKSPKVKKIRDLPPARMLNNISIVAIGVERHVPR